MTVIRTDLAPADTELDAMEMDLLAEEATDRDRVVPGDIEIEDADGCDASAVAVSRATETLMRRTETEAVSRIGGLEVRGGRPDHRAGVDAAGQCLVFGAAGHADGGDRAPGCGQVDPREGDGRGDEAHPRGGVV